MNIDNEMVRIESLRKIYGQRTVLDIPLFTFEKGKKYALVGSNGSGKSTLLRIIAGTLKCDIGKVTFCTPMQKSDIIYIPQKPYIFSFSVCRNIVLASKNGQSSESKAKALKLLDKLGMGELANEKGNKLSGGEMQKCAFARILMGDEHKLILLDEPTSQTDIASGSTVEKLLNKYLEHKEMTLIFSTHSPAQASRIADCVLFLDKGQIIEFGEARQILNNPQNEVVKSFFENWRI